MKITATFRLGYSAIVEVDAEADTQHKERWIYQYYEKEHALQLTGYGSFDKPSPRHKWRARQWWATFYKHGNTISDPAPAPQEVKDAALKAFVANITVG